MLAGRAGTLLRSLLWVTVAVAVLGMHHAPLTGSSTGHEHSGATHVSAAEVIPAATATTFASPAEAGLWESCCASVPDAAPMGERGHDEMPGGGHDDAHTGLMHLCLAIMAAMAGLVLVLFAVAWPPSADERLVNRTRCRDGFGRAPPLSTSRRLAVLCVLRQ
ncbi:hypothetical protein IU449_25380 [Nocardia higoensis]|uniref:DUF2946 domain-containing protein n=1 Tax=Nocardia higoensis TaxID=228599 RepID=A0ABS0DH98_9NOCA|nr:hypothetical protein [Nocardia higoensis]MBF6357834.1 hypothetical protein [Nocardia higoensis]